MRGDTTRQTEALVFFAPEQFIPEDHPIRAIRALVDQVLVTMSPKFEAMYKKIGRPSVAPEHLLKATLLMALYSVRSERQFCERLRYDILFKWFLGLTLNEPPFHPTTFSQNRERFLEHDVAGAFLSAVVNEAKRLGLISEEHFTADGTLLQAWASLKSYRPRDEEPPIGGGRNADVNFHGERRSRETHVSRTDPEAHLFKKAAGEAARLCFGAHLLTENRNGLVMGVLVSEATGTAEREAVLAMLDKHLQSAEGITLGADKAYDTGAFVEALEKLGVIPHIAQNKNGRRSAVPDEIARSSGYAISQRRRKLVEEVFGWLKTVAGGRKLRYAGVAKNQLWATFTVALYDIIRIVSLTKAKPLAA